MSDLKNQLKGGVKSYGEGERQERSEEEAGKESSEETGQEEKVALLGDVNGLWACPAMYIAGQIFWALEELNTPIISALSISSGYGSRVVLHDISIEIGPGDFYGVIGPNGSGKSTLLKTLTGILSPRRGKVHIYGRNIAELSPREIARKIGVIPQEVSILFPFTAGEIVAMGRHPHTRRFGRESSVDLEVIARAMVETNTYSLADRYMDELSGGERQRVIIARALCQEPEALFLDEPTSHLDINHQVEVFELLTELNRKRNLAVFVISHDLNICAEYCHELVIIKDGRINRRGAPKEIISESMVREVYGAEVSVLANPVSAAPIISIVSRGTS